MITVQTRMTSPQMKEPEQRSPTPETLLGTVSSSSLEEIASSLAIADGRENGLQMSPTSNAEAPSSVCQQRKLSAAIVTNPESSHDYATGRPMVSVEELAIARSTTSESNGSGSSSGKRLSCSADGHIDPFLDTPPHKTNTHLLIRGSSNYDRNNHRSRDEVGSSSSFHKSLTRQTSTPSYPTYAALLNDPHPMRVDAWSEAPSAHYHVRSASYMLDKKKEASDEALFSLLTVDIVRTADDKPILAGLCNHPNERLQRALRREQETGVKELPDFVWAINLAVPGPPFYHVMVYLGCDDMETLLDPSTPLGRLAKPFFFGSSDEFRDNTFKLVPKIVEGNYIVKKAVGVKPVILGRKLKQHYVRDPRFMELIVDISSDSIAKNVTGLSVGYAKQLITDMMFVLEGDSEETLPERILGGVRFHYIDFKKCDGKRVCHNYRA